MLEFFNYEKESYPNYFGLLLKTYVVVAIGAWILAMANISLWPIEWLSMLVTFVYLIIGLNYFICVWVVFARDIHGRRNVGLLSYMHIPLFISSFYSGFGRKYWLVMILSIVTYFALIILTSMIKECDQKAYKPLPLGIVDPAPNIAKLDIEKLKKASDEKYEKERKEKIVQDYDKYISARKRWIKSLLQSETARSAQVDKLLNNLPIIDKDALNVECQEMTNTIFRMLSDEIYRSGTYISDSKELPNMTININDSSLDKDDIVGIENRLKMLKNIESRFRFAEKYFAGVQNYDQVVERIFADEQLFPEQDMKNNHFIKGDIEKIKDIILAVRLGINSNSLAKLIDANQTNFERYNQLKEGFIKAGTDYKKVKTGYTGENMVEEQIKTRDYPYLRNINLPIIGRDDSFESDFIWIRPEGIFVCEVKNYTGGTLRIDKKGNVQVVSDYREDDQSPIEQNQMHCRHLNEIFENNGYKMLTKCVQGLIIVPNTGVSIKNEYNYPVLSLPFVEAYIGSNKSADLSDEDMRMIKQMLEGLKKDEKQYKFNYASMLDDDSIRKFIDKSDKLIELVQREEQLVNYNY